MSFGSSARLSFKNGPKDFSLEVVPTASPPSKLMAITNLRFLRKLSQTNKVQPVNPLSFQTIAHPKAGDRSDTAKSKTLPPALSSGGSRFRFA